MVSYLQNIDFTNRDSSTAFIYYNDQNVLYISTALQLNLEGLPGHETYQWLTISKKDFKSMRVTLPGYNSLRREFLFYSFANSFGGRGVKVIEISQD